MLDSNSYIVNNEKMRRADSARTPLLYPSYPLPWSQALLKNLAPSSGDINAFFAVMLDNIANLATVASVLINVFEMPDKFVYQNMFPGTALGVMLGCLFLAFAAIYVDRHNRETHTPDGEPYIVTAIPLGLDAPSAIGLPLLVIGPAYSAAYTKYHSDANKAAEEAWALGCATVVMIGVLKVVLALFGEKIQHFFHPAGKQGALAAIGLSLLGFLQLTSILEEPAAGLVSLWFLLLVVVSRYDEYFRGQPFKLPFRISGVLAAAIVGSIIFYVMAVFKISVNPLPEDPTKDYTLALYPHPSTFYEKMGKAISTYGSIAIPYAILVNVGGLTVVAAARAEGNDYNVTAIQMVDAVCTLIAGVCGGVIQTTPYIGHTVYHKTFKCRSFYTVANGLFIGLGGLFGYLSLISEVLPKAATIPIFIFVAFEIVATTFHDEGTPKSILTHHAPAIIFAFFPGIAQVIQIILSQLYDGELLKSAELPAQVANTTGLTDSTIATVGVVVVLSHGFIVTSLLWGSALAFVIDKKLGKASIMLLLCALLTFFGVIHSVNNEGKVYLPWQSGSDLPYQWTGGYVGMAFITLISRFFIKPDEDFGFE